MEHNLKQEAYYVTHGFNEGNYNIIVNLEKAAGKGYTVEKFHDHAEKAEFYEGKFFTDYNQALKKFNSGKKEAELEALLSNAEYAMRDEMTKAGNFENGDELAAIFQAAAKENGTKKSAKDQIIQAIKATSDFDTDAQNTFLQILNEL